MSFNSLGLSAALLRSVSEQGYTEPTPVQTEVIPAVLRGQDLIGCAETGTGKTGAFALPILQLLSERAPPPGKRRVRALIVTPTRELAAQVTESVREYGRHLRLRSAAVFGGVSIRPQIGELNRGIDILVATPGRLLDHVSQATVDLSAIEILVLDEADRMLDMGFLPDMRRIIALLPAQRQTLLFSATVSDDIRSLANRFLRSPLRIDVARRSVTAAQIDQVVHRVEKARKRELLASLIGAGKWSQVLVFTRTKHGANRLSKQLEQDGLRTAAIHGNKSQGARTRALAEFKQGTVRVLVATDVAARGLDIDALPYVVNYELPDAPEHYVHRVGRTGRAGREGIALSLVSSEERRQLADIERLLGRRIPERPLPDNVFSGAAARAEVTPHASDKPRQHRASHRPADSRHRASRRDRAVRGSRAGLTPIRPR